MKKNKAFTLIEVLVVIAIIAGMVAILYPNFMDMRERARDSQRKSDLKQIQKALELYKENHFPPSYPAALPDPCAQFIDGGNIYMAKVPGDPQGNCSGNVKRYQYYRYGSDPLRYELRACLENKQDPDGSGSQDSPYFDAPVGSGGAGWQCSPVWLYKLNEP